MKFWAGSASFTAVMQDTVLNAIGRCDGIYMRAPIWMASCLEYALQEHPIRVPVVYDHRLQEPRIEYRDADTAEHLGEILCLADTRMRS